MKEILSNLLSKWKIFAYKLGLIQSKIVLTIFFFLILSPLVILFKILGIKLIHTLDKKSSWRGKREHYETIESFTHQY